LGTRFIATTECSASDAYKQAIISAEEKDIVLSERITGVPVSVINTPYIQRMGLKAGPLARKLLRGRKTKHWMRLAYTLKSALQFRKSLHDTGGHEFWQAGKSADAIHEILSAENVVRHMVSNTKF
jgi:nitronate monooxygenase